MSGLGNAKSPVGHAVINAPSTQNSDSETWRNFGTPKIHNWKALSMGVASCQAPTSDFPGKWSAALILIAKTSAFRTVSIWTIEWTYIQTADVGTVYEFLLMFLSVVLYLYCSLL